MKLNYRDVFFYDIVESILGYSPAIEIKPVHLANGFFRAICGGFVNNQVQHKAIYPKLFAKFLSDNETEVKKKPSIENVGSNIRQVFEFLKGEEDKQEMLYLLLSADKTVFNSINTSSYTLSHASHITSDNHDRKAGMWLLRILEHGERNYALDLLRELLFQDPKSRSDELSLLTLPFDNDAKRRPILYENWHPSSLECDSTGNFRDPLIRSIRHAFDQLAEHEINIARYNGKLDALRRFVILGCFAIYLHLANSGNEDRKERIPILFRMKKDVQSYRSLYQASIQSYQWVQRSVDLFFRHEITKKVNQLAATQTHGSWETDQDIERHIKDTIDWLPSIPGMRKKRQRKDMETYQNDCQHDCYRFYLSYRGETAAQSPPEALANAFTDMLGLILSSKPQAVARALGTRIGLLSMYASHDKKTYTPQPDFLEVLIRASIPKGRTWKFADLAQHWAEEYGILFGALGNENAYLERWGISAVDRNELMDNVEALANILEISGYAHRYADGVVLVNVEG